MISISNVKKKVLSNDESIYVIYLCKVLVTLYFIVSLLHMYLLL